VVLEQITKKYEREHNTEFLFAHVIETVDRQRIVLGDKIDDWEQTLHQFHMDSFPDIQQFSQHQLIEQGLAHSHKSGGKESTIYFGTLSPGVDFTKETLINILQWLQNANLEYLNHFKQAFHLMQHNH
jgi:hypothetical protein